MWQHLEAAVGEAPTCCQAEVPVCPPDLLPGEVHCMPRVWIRDVLERLTMLVQPWGCCLLLFHRGNNDIVRGNLEHIKHDCMAPEVMVKVKSGPGGSSQSCR